MPLYEYACKTCGARFETLVMGSTKPTCPACGSDDLERLISTFKADTHVRGNPRSGRPQG